MRFNKNLVVGIFCLLCAFTASAQADKRDIQVTAYVDGSYNYLERSKYFISDFPDRINDNAENGTRLQQFYFGAESLPDKGWGAKFEMIMGSDAINLAQFGYNPNVFQLRNFGLIVPQVYLQYGFGSSALLAGEFQSLSGFETYEDLLDTNFSHGLIYSFGVAGSHDGIRWTKTINKWQLILGVVNGWNTVHEAAQMQALECAAVYTTDLVSLTIDAYVGKQYLGETAFYGPTSTRNLLDIFGSYQITKELNLVSELIYAVQPNAAQPDGTMIGRAVWSALGAWVNYQFTDKWRTALRAEIFNDANAYRTGVRQVLKEGTITVGYEPFKHFLVMLETRRDFSNAQAFVNKGGFGTGNNQQSYAVNLLYQFV